MMAGLVWAWGARTFSLETGPRLKRSLLWLRDPKSARGRLSIGSDTSMPNSGAGTRPWQRIKRHGSIASARVGSIWPWGTSISERETCTRQHGTMERRPASWLLGYDTM